VSVALFHGSLGDYASAEDVPSEFTLLKAGVNEYVDGDTIVFDSDAATAVMQRYTKRGIELMADYEHQSLQVPPVIAPAAAKKWVPEVRDGALVASSIAWTDKARAMIAAGEYRYFSIAARVDVKSKRIVELINFALTNNPAANQIAPLVAASRRFDEEAPSPVTTHTESEQMPMSENVVMALGLKADTDEASAVVEASTLAGMKKELLEITKARSVADALGTIRAYGEAQRQLLAMQARMHEIETEKRKAEFDALMKQPDVLQKLSPALQKSEWLANLRSKDDGPAQLRSFLASAPMFVPPAEEQDTVESVEISDSEMQMIKRFVGDDADALKARIDGLKAQKLQDRAARRGRKG
jgi:phage I-like protein